MYKYMGCYSDSSTGPALSDLKRQLLHNHLRQHGECQGPPLLCNALRRHT